MSSRRPTSVCHLLLICFVLTSAQSNSTTTPILSPDVCFGYEWSCKGRCNEFRSLPCSCDIRCLVYRTCCEDFEEVCDYVSHPLFSTLTTFFNISVLGITNYAFIDECLNRTNSDDVLLCEGYSGVKAGRTGPVTELSLGLQFKNDGCLRCNNLQDFIPWSLVAVCDRHATGKTEKFELDLAFIRRSCEVLVRPPSLNSTLFTPIFRLQIPGQILDEEQCSPEHVQLCKSFFSYVTASTSMGRDKLFRNRYCVICSDWTGDKCSLPLFEDLVPTGPSTFSSLLNWNMDGSWSIIATSLRSEDTVCILDPDTQRESCKSVCPNSSVRAFQSTYCLPLPIPVIIEFIGDPFVKIPKTQPLASEQLARDFSCVFHDTDIASPYMALELKLLCDWSPTYKVSIKLMTAMYNILITSLKPQIGKSQVMKIRVFYLDAFNAIINESLLVLSPNQLQSPVPDPFEWTVSIVGSSLSLISLCCRISIQPLSHLLNTQPGKMQCCLCVSLALAYVSFLLTQGLQQKSLPCWIVSILMHLLYLNSLFWMNAITVDLWKRFRYGRILSSISESRSMKLIVLYTCILPIIVVAISITMDVVLPNSKFSPAYGQILCWINNSYSLIIFFAVPVNALSFVNVVLILSTFQSLHKHHKTSKIIQTLSKSSPVLSVGVCAKMASLTGVTWLLGLAAGLVDHFVLWMIFSVVNSSYGLIVAFTLMYNRRLWLSLKLPCKQESAASSGVVQISSGVNTGPGRYIHSQRTMETSPKST